MCPAERLRGCGAARRGAVDVIVLCFCVLHRFSRVIELRGRNNVDLSARLLPHIWGEKGEKLSRYEPLVRIRRALRTKAARLRVSGG